ncbi:MAG: PQQ-binding-like beta-propeller repeat protein [Deltaproteobacteria bacterium]|nr:PQQ-binding-like beta-propeller repeat protein [Deltaproteobacteria bacterium]
MVRIRVGSGWREDPAIRLALTRGGTAAAQAVRRATDAVAIEVDGVDVARGRAEGPLLPALTSLADSLARLVAGEPVASAHLPEGAVELLLRRSGPAVLLSVVSLGRPSRVLARDVSVELDALRQAVAEAGAELLGDVASILPALSRAAACRELRRALSALSAARPARTGPRPAAVPRARVSRGRRAGPACRVELRDEEAVVESYRGPGADLASLLAPGRVVFESGLGAEPLVLEGHPFLLLRDLVALASQLPSAVQGGEGTLASSLALGPAGSLPISVDLAGGRLVAGRRPPLAIAPLVLAEAVLAAAIDFTGVLVARNAWQSGNPWVAELRLGAERALAHVREVAAGELTAAPRRLRHPRAARQPSRPLGPGRLRRLSWERTWELEVGAPAGEGLLWAGDALVVAGAEAVVALDERGAERWRGPGARWAAADGRGLLLVRGARLSQVDARSGGERWARPVPDPDARLPRQSARLRGGLLLLAAGGSLVALRAEDGAESWRFRAPGAGALWFVPAGPLAIAASDASFLHGIEGGRVAWRLLAPGPALAAPVPFGAGRCAAVCAAPVGGALLAFDPSSGRRLWEAPLDFTPAGPPLPFAGRLLVPGTVGGDPVLAAVEQDGGLAWTEAPPLGHGAPVLAASGPVALVRGGDGSCAALDRDGQLRWHAAAPTGQTPPAGLAPHLVRGVVLLPGDPLRALDARTGTLLGRAPLPPPARLWCSAELALASLDAMGTAAGARLSRRLGVLD